MKYRASIALPIFLITAGLLWPGAAVHAAAADLSTTPMGTAAALQAKPNIQLVMDDSTSMAAFFLPQAYFGDMVFQGGRFRYGFPSSYCNGAYYNPDVTYTPPPNADGTAYLAAASFTAAREDGYRAFANSIEPPTTDLSSNFDPEDYSSSTTPPPPAGRRGPAFYFKYTGKSPATQAQKIYGALSNSIFHGECASEEGVAPGKDVFQKVIVGAKSGPGGTDERINFANWYSYYRARIHALKAGLARAFMNIDDKVRVGIFSTSAPKAPFNYSPSHYLKIANFSGQHRKDFFGKIHNMTVQGSTPLRAALTRAGLIYAGTYLPADDPVQYSCQNNYTLLSTDGYWNHQDENDPGYFPQKIDGTPIGDEDATLASPMQGAGASPTLADVAAYYYNTDLRTQNCTNSAGNDVCQNNVPVSADDNNPAQHMTTFTIGLGVDGTLNYDPDYDTATSGHYYEIKQGTKQWPDPILAPEGGARIDDLWHAAVNGHGKYFSAQNTPALITGLNQAISAITRPLTTGSLSAAATSNLEPVTNDNFVYMASYRSPKWDGELKARTINPDTGTLSTSDLWSAQAKLDTKVSADSDTRTIYSFKRNVINKLEAFTWANLSDNQRDYFRNLCGNPVKLSQCANLKTSQVDTLQGENLVNFIRGRQGFEERGAVLEDNRVYRWREHVLGDIVNAQPVHVKRPPFKYSDANYSNFRDVTQLNRAGRVYVAANDGMLHAFNADTGVEEWAYIPRMVMPNLYQLADKEYAGRHRFFVDGTPVVGDICPRAPGNTCSGDEWRTILVGGLNLGGSGYYALDITDTSSPKALWNFTDKDLGFSYGNPVITKRSDGTWVVVFASGYNNIQTGAQDDDYNTVSGTGDGRGYLYVINASTGALLEKITTGVGDTTTPSGLAKINAWIDSPTDNTAKRFYGGDLLGNVWRFRIGNGISSGTNAGIVDAFKLAELGNEGTAGVQPITIKPELTEIEAGGHAYAVVHVATGRYLGATDLADTSQQSIYAIKDSLTETSLGNARAMSAGLVRQTLSAISGGRTTTRNPVDWSSANGWYVDLNPGNASPGERVTVEMQQQLGLLTVIANVPNTTGVCTPLNSAWLYSFDLRTGQFAQGATGQLAGQKVIDGDLGGGLKTVRLTTGQTVTAVTRTDGSVSPYNDPASPGAGGAGARRVSWRELTE